MSKAKKHEPLVHITKRGTLPLWHNLAIRAIGLGGMRNRTLCAYRP